MHDLSLRSFWVFSLGLCLRSKNSIVRKLVLPARRNTASVVRRDICFFLSSRKSPAKFLIVSGISTWLFI